MYLACTLAFRDTMRTCGLHPVPALWRLGTPLAPVACIPCLFWPLWPPVPQPA